MIGPNHVWLSRCAHRLRPFHSLESPTGHQYRIEHEAQGPMDPTYEALDRLRQRKEAAGLAHRDDLKNFVDFIDADEKRI